MCWLVVRRQALITSAAMVHGVAEKSADLLLGGLGGGVIRLGHAKESIFPVQLPKLAVVPRSNENRCDSINPLTAAHHTWGSVNDSRGEAQAAE